MEEIDKVEIKDEDLEEQDFSQDELDDDSTDWKAKAAELKGIAKRRATQLKRAKEALAKQPESKPKEPEKNKPSGLDYGQKAFLKASGVVSEDFDYIQEVMEYTKKDLEQVLDSKYVQAEIKERKDARTAKEALPSSSKRSNTSTHDSVDYWVSKGELPPADQVELRRKVVKARVMREESLSKFSDNPVVK